MATTYRDLNDFRQAKQLARTERDRAAEEVSQRWDLLQNPTTRGVLLRDAVGDLLRSWKPYRKVHDLLEGRVNGDAVAALGQLYASTRPTWMARAVYSGLSALLATVIGRSGPSNNELLHAATRQVGSLFRRWKARTTTS